jgi:diguanylate cyclase (GGDEF)-like protein
VNRDRLANIAEAIANSSFEISINSIRVVYWFEDEWHDVKNAAKEHKLGGHLTGFRDGSAQWSMLSKATVAFRLSAFNAVVVINFSRSPRQGRIEKVNEKLLDLVRRNDDAFHASHDGLTECLNKRAFEGRLKERLEKKQSASGSSVSGAMALSSASVYLISLDIDHFKYINDTYGHQYGDVVLRAFAWRVSNICKKAEEESSGRFRAEFARPGGEEFQVIVSGLCSELEVIELGEKIRAGIQSDPLPSDMEFKTIDRDGLKAGIDLPIPSQRRITASLGVASSACVSVNERDERAALLIRQADIAVYSSKLAGRNQVRNFPDILNGYGRVIEQHKETGILAVDIGREVGVRLGQEFFLIPYDFTGGVDFYAGEGRSRKKVGVYPRVRAGRIVIFDVQPEVSFARIVELDPGMSAVAIGSYLEAIPLGSITHLIEGATRTGTFVSSEEIRASIKKNIQEGNYTSLLAIGVADIEKVLSEYGSGFVNSLLAKIHGKIKEFTHGKCKISHIEPANLIAEIIQDDKVERNIDALMDSLKEDALEGIRFVGGVFSPSAEPELLPEYGVEFAVTALRASEIDGGIWSYFNSDCVDSVLQDARSSDKSRALADYRKFIEMGIRTAEMENVAGLLELERPGGDWEASELHFKAAYEIEPHPIYRSNLAVIYFLLKKYEESYRIFSAIEDEGGFEGIPEDYTFLYAASAYEIRDTAIISRASLRHLLSTVLGSIDNNKKIGVTPIRLKKMKEYLEADSKV